MAKRPQHPFTITISAPARVPGRYCWQIREKGAIVKQSPVTYSTFEDARITGKASLDYMILQWAEGRTFEVAA